MSFHQNSRAKEQRQEYSYPMKLVNSVSQSPIRKPLMVLMNTIIVVIILVAFFFGKPIEDNLKDLLIWMGGIINGLGYGTSSIENGQRLKYETEAARFDTEDCQEFEF